jgi:lipopolysaccharide biosynthesis glycosyltransferase
MQRSIWIGFDPREAEAFGVCRYSLRHFAPGIPVHAVLLDELRDRGLYRRPTSQKDGRLWDDISAAPMATEFAISRFLTPRLAQRGWALFMDCDIFARDDLDRLWAALDPSKAVMCVKHPNYTPPDQIKMDGQLQTLYARKNWSSVMAFNCEHPANRALTVDLINTVPGRDLHRFCWLQDKEIGSLDQEWNFLVGVTDPEIEPSLVHFTSGGPWFADYRDVPYADEWLALRRQWLRPLARERSYDMVMPA